ncbi:hypothetical protein [Cupriavidus necator]|uniref:hypothetical protein n=1 Tax=Cupriavidus necator TaxID=106590 RepID=UPI0005B40B7F|nr:hypothetical protein [Cupriavidus necator]
MALSKKDKKGLVLMTIAGGVLLAMVGGKLAVGSKPKSEADGCVGAVTANTVIVFDHSEQLTDQTRAEIVARALAYIRDKTQTNERVTVFNVSEVSRTSLAPAFSRCKPSQAGNRLVEDVRGIEKAYKRDFLEPVTMALSAAPSNAKESPIAQAIIDLSLSQYLRGQRNTLLVFSDLMEHTPPKFSLYSCGDAARTVALFRESRRGAQERPKFANTSVYLNVVPRIDLPKASLKCRDQLWPWFFGDNEGAGAKVEIDYLPGA